MKVYAGVMTMNQRNALAHQDDDNTPVEHLHPSLQASFVPLPKAGETLTPHQLQAIFGGDLRAIYDLAQLAYSENETDAK